LYVFAGYSAENLQRKLATIMDWVSSYIAGFSSHLGLAQEAGKTS